MTEKEKAKELVDKFYYGGYKKPLFYDNAQRCALIAVDEIIKVSMDNLYTERYWQQVKQEIEKL